jgi:hypothetical protein
MQIIQHQELASAQASITFSSIPQTFTDLYLVTSVRGVSTEAAARTSTKVSINGSDANASSRLLYGFDSNQVGSETVTSFPYSGTQPNANATTNTFGSTSLYFPNYKVAANKPFSVDFAAENNTSTYWILGFSSGLWSQTAAITSLTIAAPSGNLAQYSSATLYGILAGSDGIVTVS